MFLLLEQIAYQKNSSLLWPTLSEYLVFITEVYSCFCYVKAELMNARLDGVNLKASVLSFFLVRAEYKGNMSIFYFNFQIKTVFRSLFEIFYKFFNFLYEKNVHFNSIPVNPIIKISRLENKRKIRNKRCKCTIHMRFLWLLI